MEYFETQAMLNKYLILMSYVEDEIDKIYYNLKKTGQLYGVSETNIKLKKLQEILKQLNEKYEGMFRLEEKNELSQDKLNELNKFYLAIEKIATPLVSVLSNENEIN